MQDPFGFSENSFKRPKPKPPRKQVGLLQPKAPSQFLENSSTTSAPVKASKRPRKKKLQQLNEVKCVSDNYDTSMSAMPTKKPVASAVIDSTNMTEENSRNMYRVLKRKFTNLELESIRLAEELERTDNEVRQLEDEKHLLLDELLVLEGLAYNPYPPVEP
jgi:hypothetical protein